jgi:hypothetical protein
MERVLPVSFEKRKDLCELHLAQLKAGFDKPVEIAPQDSLQIGETVFAMFVIPAKVSGVERFDQEAQLAIGAASPLPVPQDNEAFAQISEITIAVQAPERLTQPTQPAKPVPKKEPK